MKSLNLVTILLLSLILSSCGKNDSPVPTRGGTFTISEYLQNKSSITKQDFYSAMRANKATLENVYVGQAYTLVTHYIRESIFAADLPCKGTKTTEEFYIVALVENNTEYQERLDSERVDYTNCSTDFDASSESNVGHASRAIDETETTTVEGLIAEMEQLISSREFSVTNISRGTYKGKLMFQLTVNVEGARSIILMDPSLPLTGNPIIIEAAGTDDEGVQHMMVMQRTLKN